MMPPATSRLRQLIERSSSTRSPAASRALQPADENERCEMCSVAIPEEHRHIFEGATRALLCVCRPCSLLFDHDAAGAGGERFRLVPGRRLRVEDLRFDELAWRSLRIPVELAFFVRGGAGGMTAHYPSPAGPIESLLPLDAWSEIERDNPLLRDLRPDVEALLVNRLGAAPQAWLVGIDVCYRLVALFRQHWSGMSGGSVVWAQTSRFFDELAPRKLART